MDNLDVFTMRVVLGDGDMLVRYVEDKAVELGLSRVSVKEYEPILPPSDPSVLMRTLEIKGDTREATALASAVMLDILEVIKSVEGDQEPGEKRMGWKRFLKLSYRSRSLALAVPTLSGKLDGDIVYFGGGGGCTGPRGTTGSPGDKGLSGMVDMDAVYCGGGG